MSKTSKYTVEVAPKKKKVTLEDFSTPVPSRYFTGTLHGWKVKGQNKNVGLKPTPVDTWEAEIRGRVEKPSGGFVLLTKEFDLTDVTTLILKVRHLALGPETTSSRINFGVIGGPSWRSFGEEESRTYTPELDVSDLSGMTRVDIAFAAEGEPGFHEVVGGLHWLRAIKYGG